MTLLRLIVREIAHRRVQFALGLLSVVVAVTCLVATDLALLGHDVRTEEILAATEKKTEERAKWIEDEYRRITKNLGHNLLIVHRDLDLTDFHADEFANKYLPEEYADRLAQSQIITVNHLLPSLTQKIRWPEQQRTIQLIGTKGQVPILHRNPKKPIQESVAPGGIVLGHALAEHIGLKVGDSTTLLETTFRVSKIHDRRGTKDDITAWIHLATAQKLLDRDGQINAILALECNCPGSAEERLRKIEAEITNVLPDTRIIALDNIRVARAKARKTAQLAALDSVEAQQAQRLDLRGEREELAALLVPALLLGCALWVGLLALGNARDRAPEVGVLRAIGIRSRDVLWVFLGRAGAMGFTGALLGCALGVAAGASWAGLPIADSLALLRTSLIVGVVVAAPLVTMAATAVPAMVASRHDPAVVLRGD